MCVCYAPRPAGSGAQNAAVFVGSFLEYDWSDGDCVFANSTCFPEELMDALGRQVGDRFTARDVKGVLANRFRGSP